MATEAPVLHEVANGDSKKPEVVESVTTKESLKQPPEEEAAAHTNGSKECSANSCGDVAAAQKGDCGPCGEGKKSATKKVLDDAEGGEEEVYEPQDEDEYGSQGEEDEDDEEREEANGEQQFGEEEDGDYAEEDEDDDGEEDENEPPVKRRK